MIAAIPGFEGLYEIDTDGNVFGVERRVLVCHGAFRTIKRSKKSHGINRGGYAQVSLCKNGQSKTHRIHRLVMLTFAYQPGCESLDVNHKDGNRANNKIENLEWATRSENHRHAFRELGKKTWIEGRFGSAHPRSIPIIGTPIKGGSEVRFQSLTLAQKSGFCPGHISDCLSGKRRKHKGYVWSVAPNLEPFICKEPA